jgi:hypothetical protein
VLTLLGERSAETLTSDGSRHGGLPYPGDRFVGEAGVVHQGEQVARHSAAVLLVDEKLRVAMFENPLDAASCCQWPWGRSVGNASEKVQWSSAPGHVLRPT